MGELTKISNSGSIISVGGGFFRAKSADAFKAAVYSDRRSPHPSRSIFGVFLPVHAFELACGGSEPFPHMLLVAAVLGVAEVMFLAIETVEISMINFRNPTRRESEDETMQRNASEFHLWPSAPDIFGV